MGHSKLSVFLSYVLRHNPEAIGIKSMDKHGFVRVDELIDAINKKSKYSITREVLNVIVKEDGKQRYAFDETGSKICAVQGHSIPNVEPVLAWKEPPALLFHGTTMQAYGLIVSSGVISKMTRHHVHLQELESKAWQSAKRRKDCTPIVLKIDAAQMHQDGYSFGQALNGVWCAESIPVEYICGVLYGS